MSKSVRMSSKTRANWLIDAAVFIGGLLAALSGIYFLFLPSAGYQGGRNPTYGLTILFERHTWSDLHLWSGIAMIAAVVIHLSIHWAWVQRMSRRVVSALKPEGAGLSRGGVINLIIDGVIALSFLVCALSGIYFMFGPSGGFEGGRNALGDPGFLFSRTVWDLIHTWSGIILIVAAVLHLAIHWRWVKNVTLRFFRSLLPDSESSARPKEAAPGRIAG